MEFITKTMDKTSDYKKHYERDHMIRSSKSGIKRSPLRKKSFKKLLREEVGKAQLEYLRFARKNEHTCDICGKWRPFLSRFHILPVGNFPKMEFVDENILLTDWLPCHHKWHHSYEDAKDIEKRIKELKGKNYKNILKAINEMQPKQTELILGAKLEWYKIETRNLLKREEL